MARYAVHPRRSDRRSALAGLLAVLASLLLFSRAEGAAAADEPRLLMLPIVVHSSEDPDYLRSGLSDMLASRFERLGALDLVRGEFAGRGTTDVDKAIALARKKGADFVLYGSFTRFGQGASLDVQCAPVAKGPGNVEQEPLREIFVHSGSIGEIIPDLDELAGKVSRFARGERVESAGSGFLSPANATAAASGRAVIELTGRVEALEAALAQVLESAEESAGNAGMDAELR